MDDLIRQLAEAGNKLPREAMQAATANWEQAAPPLLALLEEYASGCDRSEAAANAVFFILYLVAQQRERRAFPAICHLALDGEAMEQALGDGITEDLAAILAATFDGDLDRLRQVILKEDSDEFIRCAAIEALTRLHAEGTLPMETAEASLRDLHDRMLPRDVPDMVWVGWQQAVSVLGLAALRPQVIELFRNRRIDRGIMERKDFEADLRAGLAPGADRVALLQRHGGKPIEDAVAHLSTWHGFQEQEEGATPRPLPPASGFDALGPGFWNALREPAVNPYRDVGRNDPCPCGSGKKFKKCCMPA